MPPPTCELGSSSPHDLYLAPCTNIVTSDPAARATTIISAAAAGALVIVPSDKSRALLNEPTFAAEMSGDDESRSAPPRRTCRPSALLPSRSKDAESANLLYRDPIDL